MNKHKNHIKEGPFSGDSEEVSCPICSSPPAPQLIYQRQNGVGIWQCPDCQIMYASPRFTEKSLMQIYETPDFITGDGYEMFKGWNYENWRESKDETYIISEIKVETVKKYLAPGDRILDVGCGVGFFITEALKQGFKAEGLEPSEMLCDIARKDFGLDIHNILIEDFKPTCKFRAIILWDVLEHVYDPVRVLQRCCDLTEDEGFLFISVPNSKSLADRLKKQLYRLGLRSGEFKHFGFPWHIYSYNINSMTALLGKGCYKPLTFTAPSHHVRRGTSNIFSRMIEPFFSSKCLGANLTCVAQKE